MSRRYDVIAAGLAVSDILAYPVDRSVFDADSTELESVTYAAGGDALNCATDLAKLGRAVAVSCRVGDDLAGISILRNAEAAGVDISLAERSKTSTATSVVLCSRSGERNFAYFPGSNNEYRGAGLTDEVLAQTKILFVGSMMALPGLDGDVLASLFKRARDHGVITAMDVTWPSDGVWLPKIEAALPYTDIFMPSLYEAEHIAGSGAVDEIIAFLHGRGVGIAGVKLGAAGVAIEKLRLPAYNCPPGELKDTCGAGDAFMAGFLCGISEGKSVRDCAVLGSAVANFCIRASGATAGVADYVKTMKFIKENGELK